MEAVTTASMPTLDGAEGRHATQAAEEGSWSLADL